MTTSEPTTEEIVRNFRGAHIFGITQALENRIADRLESLQRTVAEKDAQIAKLTARAEQAEAREKAAVADLEFFGKNIHTCKHSENCQSTDATHESCHDCELWTWRGQPQEGEGK